MHFIPINKQVYNRTAIWLEIRVIMANLFATAPIKIYYAYYSASEKLLKHGNLTLTFSLSEETLTQMRSAVTAAINKNIEGGVMHIMHLYNSKYIIRYSLSDKKDDEWVTLDAELIPLEEQDNIRDAVMSILDVTIENQGIGYWAIESNFIIQ